MHYLTHSRKSHTQHRRSFAHRPRLVTSVLRLAACLILLFPAGLRLSAQQYWQQQVNYAIDISLNDTEHTLDGFVKIQYSNHSPDTLSFIWFHLWPNAYKNDGTAFSEQLLGNGRTDFYFSTKEQKGYINRLDFRVDGSLARMEDHPQYIDIIKVILPQPLPPGGQITITTPFHEQLPFNFSRGGHVGRTYQLTQWYPKPAVYDRQGWHPIPYLDQGEFYSEYGNFDVRITLPETYVVAATGELKDAPPPASSKFQEMPPARPPRFFRPPTPKHSPASSKPAANHKPAQSTAADLPANRPASDFSGATSLPYPHPLVPPANKTLHYIQNNIHDFALFASRSFQVDHDTLQLASGRIIDVYSFYSPEAGEVWKNSIRLMKRAIRFRSALIGEYPFNIVSAAEVKMGTWGGMEYPTITAITPQKTEKSLDLILEHELGHNWFYAVLGTDERRYPWMDEGINTYYDKRYEQQHYGSAHPSSAHPSSAKPPATLPPTTQPIIAPSTATAHPVTSKHRAPATRRPIAAAKPHPTHPHEANNAWLLRKLPADQDRLFVDAAAKQRQDQPISTSSEDFTAANYDLIAYTKAALWMQQLEQHLGTPLFDSCMQAWFRLWQFRHPAPGDFRSVIESTSCQPQDSLFALLDKKGPLTPFNTHRTIRPTLLFSARNTGQIDYINILPALGVNKYDGLMLGALIHNYNLPPDKFQFFLAPLYATNSHQLNGIGGASYTWYPDNRFRKIVLGLTGSRFSSVSGADSNGNKLFGGFYKFAPSLRLTLNNPTARSTLERWVEWKTYLIGEKSFTNYVIKSTDSIAYPLAAKKYAFRYLNQLSFNIEDKRALYPYRALLQLQQASAFYRLNLTGNYFFNYSKGGGMDLRIFAAKFGYIGNKNSLNDIQRYMPKLTGVTGNEDYTYSNYFYGRNEFTGLASQQIMIRDGGLKIRVPNFDFLEGRSDNWVAALNFNSTLPRDLVPSWLPLKLFFDLGTYSGGWQNNAPTSKFLYTAGLQLSLFHNVFNIYAPVIYSSDFRDQLKTLADQNGFFKKISFSIDIQNISIRTLFPNNIPL